MVGCSGFSQTRRSLNSVTAKPDEIRELDTHGRSQGEKDLHLRKLIKLDLTVADLVKAKFHYAI